ncbi:MAG: hypothetical protein EON52_15080 [Actinomycetales bacterium]|nr:MAG: hypothetical protein EON52_15080 [Actinomycetales bacterium]
MGKALLLVFAVVLLVYAFFDLVATPASRVKVLPKPLWFLVVVLVPFVGPLLWVAAGQQRHRPGPGGRPNPRSQGPDDDPDYLRGL